MTINTTADELAKELSKTSEENEKFLADIDTQIKKADLHYAQMLVDEEKGYLKMAKKNIKEKE